MQNEKEHPLKFLKPSFASVGIFLLFVVIHILGSHDNAPFSESPMRFRLPIFQQYQDVLPSILGSLFAMLWAFISMPLFLVGRAVISLFSYIGINLYDFLNDWIVFIIFILYYYFVASVIASVIKKE